MKLCFARWTIKVFSVVGTARGGAEDTNRRGITLSDVLITPWGPEIVHVTGSEPARSRPGPERARGRGAGAVDHVLQFLARLEIGDFLGGNFHPRAGLRIAADTGLALAGAEAAESADFDLVAGPEGTYDTVENGLHDDFGFLPGHLYYAGDFFNQIGLGHRILLALKYWHEIAVSPEFKRFATYSWPRSFKLRTSSMVVVAAAAWRW